MPAVWSGAAAILVGCIAGCTAEQSVQTTRPETPAPIAGTVAPDGTITQITDVAFTGTKSTTVQLTPGVWTYLCQPHSTQMRGSFTVS